MVPIVTTLLSSLVCIVKSTFLFGSYSASTVPVDGVVVCSVLVAGAAAVAAGVAACAVPEPLLQEANTKIMAITSTKMNDFLMTSSNMFIISYLLSFFIQPA